MPEDAHVPPTFDAPGVRVSINDGSRAHTVERAESPQLPADAAFWQCLKQLRAVATSGG
jgi:hypothetical protein